MVVVEVEEEEEKVEEEEEEVVVMARMTMMVEVSCLEQCTVMSFLEFLCCYFLIHCVHTQCWAKFPQGHATLEYSVLTLKVESSRKQICAQSLLTNCGWIFSKITGNMVFKSQSSTTRVEGLVDRNQDWWAMPLTELPDFIRGWMYLPWAGQRQMLPWVGQVARNSLGIHGVVSQIPGLLHHLSGSGLFSVLSETVPCWWDKYPINHTHMETEHSRQPRPLVRHLTVHFCSEVYLDPHGKCGFHS